MKEIIKINTNENDITLSGRELHEFLEIKTEYKKWFSRMIEYGFTENVDYQRVTQKCPTLGGVQEIVDHEIKLDMAKEIAMIQRNEKGKQARKYFLEVEKAWNSPEMIMKRALEIANKRVENLQLENTQQKQIIGELKPKADYTDIILKNKGLVTITQIAKDYGLSGQALNDKLHELKIQYKIGEQWLLYSKYHAKGYTHSETIPITRKNGMKDVNMITKWTQKGRLFIYELLKKNNILPLIESEEF
ncbi:phage antirepressor KilAC domain-containing protein [Clostridium tertium]|uniref:phage antirepressor KilAC domain-containing protein n=3 Tax=Clostridium TaxID=1485 RepID=UPI002064E3E1|nr:phage antirepressor KilAC domain-containing protein [Clostridium tertium]MDB1933933.1 phage antirepressor KilAC domain-containing protein [Clostridium tertium]MDB1936550.1 phage antirepressor KilAC domain-containing protein [Clostridium tertium]DAO81036.1 MAG TPA: antirepressor protein [Caudoviricetes sp.]